MKTQLTPDLFIEKKSQPKNRETMVEVLIETRGTDHLDETIAQMQASDICKRFLS